METYRKKSIYKIKIYDSRDCANELLQILQQFKILELQKPIHASNTIHRRAVCSPP